MILTKSVFISLYFFYDNKIGRKENARTNLVEIILI